MKVAICSTGKSPLLRINRIGYAQDPEDVRFLEGKRAFYLIHYVLSGKGYFNGNLVTRGQGFLISPHSVQEYYPAEDDPWTYLWVESQDARMEDLFPFFRANEKNNIFEYHNLEAVQTLAEYIQQNFTAVISSSLMLEKFMHIYNETINLLAPPVENTSSEEIYFKYAKKYVESNFHTHITVQALTDILGISQPYLYRIFQKKVGKSPKKYIDDYKFFHAKMLLEDSNLTVTQVAHSVGFDDVLAFSKFFSTREQLSPSAYRAKKIRTKGTVIQ